MTMIQINKNRDENIDLDSRSWFFSIKAYPNFEGHYGAEEIATEDGLDLKLDRLFPAYRWKIADLENVVLTNVSSDLIVRGLPADAKFLGKINLDLVDTSTDNTQGANKYIDIWRKFLKINTNNVQQWQQQHDGETPPICYSPSSNRLYIVARTDEQFREN